jgi:hypothetical protein
MTRLPGLGKAISWIALVHAVRYGGTSADGPFLRSFDVLIPIAGPAGWPNFEVGPDVGPAPAAGATDEARFEIGQPRLIGSIMARPSVSGGSSIVLSVTR